MNDKKHSPVMKQQQGKGIPSQSRHMSRAIRGHQPHLNPPTTTSTTSSSAYTSKTQQPQQKKRKVSKKVTTIATIGTTISTNQGVKAQQIDVKLGRGKSYRRNPGNVMLHDLVSSYRLQYLSSENISKRKITMDIIDAIHGNGGRFIKKMDDNDSDDEIDDNDEVMWSVVSTETARQKVAHAMQYLIRLLGNTPLVQDCSETDAVPPQKSGSQIRRSSYSGTIQQKDAILHSDNPDGSYKSTISYKKRRASHDNTSSVHNQNRMTMFLSHNPTDRVDSHSLHHKTLDPYPISCSDSKKDNLFHPFDTSEYHLQKLKSIAGKYQQHLETQHSHSLRQNNYTIQTANSIGDDLLEFHPVKNYNNFSRSTERAAVFPLMQPSLSEMIPQKPNFKLPTKQLGIINYNDERKPCPSRSASSLLESDVGESSINDHCRSSALYTLTQLRHAPSETNANNATSDISGNNHNKNTDIESKPGWVYATNIDALDFSGIGSLNDYDFTMQDDTNKTDVRCTTGRCVNPFRCTCNDMKVASTSSIVERSLTAAMSFPEGSLAASQPPTFTRNTSDFSHFSCISGIYNGEKESVSTNQSHSTSNSHTNIECA